MSEENKDNSLNEMLSALKGAFEDVVKNALRGAQGDVKAYAQQLAQEYGKYLWRQYKDGDYAAERNLEHLEAQVALIAVKRELVISRESLAQLKVALETAAAIGIRALIAAAVAAL